MSRERALARVKAHVDGGEFLDELRARVAVPTESQEPERAPELRRYLAEVMAPWLDAVGFASTIVDNPVAGGGPFLLAERVEDPALSTVLTYGHGDVVRGLPEQWSDGLDPWAVTVRGERWYGRGTADNKGQHGIVLAAMRAVLQERGRLGFNAKVILETSEEVGSPGLDEVVAAHKDALACDAFIASDGPRLKPERADIKLGNRGAFSFDLRVALREGSRHSGHWGGVLEDPGVTLAHAIAAICERRGRIRVREWCPREIPPAVRAMIAECVVDPGPDFPPIPEDWGEPGLTREEKMFGWTSFIVLAFVTGRPENPINGVQPDAFARCQLRFTADVDPATFLPVLRAHLDAHGLAQVEIAPAGHGLFPAWRTDPANPWVAWARDSVARTHGERPLVVPNGAGGLPSATFGNHLACPVLWLPHSYTGCRQHGPDEHLLEPLVRAGLATMTGLFWDLGAAPPGQ